MSKFAFIFGTRPEVIKCAPLILEAKSQGLEVVTLFTGQHKEMALPILNFFDININIDLDIMKPGQSLIQMSSTLLTKLDDKLSEVKSCDWIIVQGDTTSAFMGAYFGFLNKIPVAHLEAGLRTYNLASPFPEEANRQLISKIATLHLTPTEHASKALINEGIHKDLVKNVGNTVIDSLLEVNSRINHHDIKIELEKHGIDSNKEYVLITGHRRENIGDGFKNICSAIKELALENPELNFIYPVHLNPMVKDFVFENLSDIQNIKLIKPLDYVPFITLMSGSKLIMTDSGGIQEEAPSLKKYVIVLRDTTEREEGVNLGVAFLVGTSRENIIKQFNILKDQAFDESKKNPYGDGKSSERIINILKGKEV